MNLDKYEGYTGYAPLCKERVGQIINMNYDSPYNKLIDSEKQRAWAIAQLQRLPYIDLVCNSDKVDHAIKVVIQEEGTVVPYKGRLDELKKRMKYNDEVGNFIAYLSNDGTIGIRENKGSRLDRKTLVLHITHSGGYPSKM